MKPVFAAAPTLADVVERLPGVGPVRAGALGRLGVATVGDLLRLLPRRYEDRRRLGTIAGLAGGPAGSFVARVAGAGPETTPRRRRRIFRAVLEDDSGRVRAVWFRFRAAHLQTLLAPGARLLVHGSVVGSAGRYEIHHPELEPLAEEGRAGVPALRPVYPVTEGIAQTTLRTLVRRALDAVLPGLEDPLPGALRSRLGLPGLAAALAAVHAPGDDADAAALGSGRSPWHRRIAFDGLLGLQLDLAARRRGYELAGARRARPLPADLLERLGERLAFSLTAAQRRVCRELLADLGGSRPMQRLLQGDVGSGKTVVAALAVLATTARGAQAALLVPTEPLAEQHLATLRPLAAQLGFEVGLLTRGVPRERAARLLAALEGGRVQLVVGTHALLEERVRFKQLGLAIVDEQHRFGVRQRLRLREKGGAPDLLVMTATPIPRSLALALYGDLDLSVIDELPPGRRPVTTRVVGEAGRRAAWELLRAELSRGRRAYVVCPQADARDDPGAGDLEAAEDPLIAARVAARLRVAFPELQVGLVHGRMSPEERARALRRFRSGEAPLLAATTVVEVGLDVPEATVMIVERAERFGLSQLHQLRGRVGRGPDPAHCLLLTGPQPTPEALERLGVLARTTDGFAVAEADLALRGPGQLAGTRQAGQAGAGLAAAARDPALLALACEEARRIVEADPRLELPEHRGLLPPGGGGEPDAAGLLGAG